MLVPLLGASIAARMAIPEEGVGEHEAGYKGLDR